MTTIPTITRTGIALAWRLNRRDRRDNTEWAAPCGCAFHPEPAPHWHPCRTHRPMSLSDWLGVILFLALAEALDLLSEVREHLSELEEAWRRGALAEYDGKGGTRSNRNVELVRKLDRLLGSPALQPFNYVQGQFELVGSRVNTAGAASGTGTEAQTPGQGAGS